jgi:hypothetical protein
VEVRQLSEELKALKSIENKLDQILKWTRFAGVQQLKNILSQNLENDTTTLIYEFSDGERGTREIAGIVGVRSHATIARYWEKWSKLGIVEPSPTYQGRYRRICSLEEVGLTIPPVPQAGTARAQGEQEPEADANE